MVAVTSQDDAAAKVVPVTLTPHAQGTLALDRHPHDRVRSGGSLPAGHDLPGRDPGRDPERARQHPAAAVRFTFETPPPRVAASWPTSGPQRRDVPMFVLFDQKIDALAVLATITVKANGQAESLRLLDADELDKHPTVKSLAEAARAAGQDGRWLAFRTERLLPADADVEVTVGPGTPSAEGPGRTRDRQSSSFRTYAPLRIDEARCGWSDECPPGAPYAIEFNNPLDHRPLRQPAVHGEPRPARAQGDPQRQLRVAAGRDRGQPHLQGHRQPRGDRRVRADARARRDGDLEGRPGPAQPVWPAGAGGGRPRRQAADPRLLLGRPHRPQGQAVQGHAGRLGPVRGGHAAAMGSQEPTHPARHPGVRSQRQGRRQARRADRDRDRPDARARQGRPRPRGGGGRADAVEGGLRPAALLQLGPEHPARGRRLRRR
jgi:hypothetical protein